MPSGRTHGLKGGGGCLDQMSEHDLRGIERAKRWQDWGQPDNEDSQSRRVVGLKVRSSCDFRSYAPLRAGWQVLRGKVDLRSHGLTLTPKESPLIPVARIKAAIRPVLAVRFPDRFRPGTVAL